MSTEIRSWRLHRQIHLTFFDLARRINLIVRGWMQYYGAFYRSELHPLLQRINAYLMRWVRKKYRRLPVSVVGCRTGRRLTLTGSSGLVAGWRCSGSEGRGRCVVVGR
ncbi:group II intron maturase-specific domain-containing protein [Streptomyces sp. NPDC001698]|uniref:group II intron maturase-specific domain-containing protein n=1 Tax=unclassified Streptomyces TaxID=2593676 RepID=UPI0036947F5F